MFRKETGHCCLFMGRPVGCSFVQELGTEDLRDSVDA